MLRIVECESGTEMKRFFQTGKTPFGCDERYLRLYVPQAANTLGHNGPMKYLLALRDECPCGRVMTFADRHYETCTGRREGFFSLPSAEDAEVCALLMKRAEEIQTEWGNEYLTGPVSPNGSGFFEGLSAGECLTPMTGNGNSFIQTALEDGNYVPFCRTTEYRIRVPEENPLEALALRAQNRFDLHIHPFSGLRGRMLWQRWVCDTAPADRRPQILREAERIAALVRNPYSFAAVRNGVCVGYALTMRTPKAALRVATLDTKKGSFTAATALCLLSALCGAFRKDGVKEVYASVIDTRNLSSNALVERFKGEKIRVFQQYTKKLQ